MPVEDHAVPVDIVAVAEGSPGLFRDPCPTPGPFASFSHWGVRRSQLRLYRAFVRTR